MIKNADIAQLGDFYAAYKDIKSPNRGFQHYHDSYEICFFVNVNQVDLEIFTKDTRYEVQDGDIIFFSQYNIHSFIYNNPSMIYQRYLINFKKDFILPNLQVAGIESILDDLEKSRYTHAKTNLKEKNELEFLFKSIIHANNFSSETITENFKMATVKSYLMLILIHVWKLIKNKNTNPENPMTKKDKLVQDIIHFIDENYLMEINLDLLEDKFFVNKYHISRTFKDVTGFSLIEYVQHRRIIEAQKMLKNTNRKIVDICLDSGFNNIQHFYRVFKKISGTTPDIYRRSRFN